MKKPPSGGFFVSRRWRAVCWSVLTRVVTVTLEKARRVVGGCCSVLRIKKGRYGWSNDVAPRLPNEARAEAFRRAPQFLSDRLRPICVVRLSSPRRPLCDVMRPSGSNDEAWLKYRGAGIQLSARVYVLRGMRLQVPCRRRRAGQQGPMPAQGGAVSICQPQQNACQISISLISDVRDKIHGMTPLCLDSAQTTKRHVKPPRSREGSKNASSPA